MQIPYRAEPPVKNRDLLAINPYRFQKQPRYRSQKSGAERARRGTGRGNVSADRAANREVEFITARLCARLAHLPGTLVLVGQEGGE